MFYKSKKAEVSKAQAAVSGDRPGGGPPPLPSHGNGKHGQEAVRVGGADELAAGTEQEEAPKELSAEELKRRAGHVKHLSASFGEIVSILMRRKESRGMTLAQLETSVLPAVATGQFLIASVQNKANGMAAPLAVVLWASVSDEIDRKLSSNLDQSISLEAKDWKSGSIPWLIVASGDQKAIGGLLNKLRAEHFKDRPMKFRTKDQNERPIVASL